MTIKTRKLDNLDLEKFRECVQSEGLHDRPARGDDHEEPGRAECSASGKTRGTSRGSSEACARSIPAILATEIKGRTKA